MLINILSEEKALIVSIHLSVHLSVCVWECVIIIRSYIPTFPSNLNPSLDGIRWWHKYNLLLPSYWANTAEFLASYEV